MFLKTITLVMLICILIPMAYAEKIKAFHVTLMGVDQKPYLLSTIDKLSGKFNMLIIGINDKYNYASFPELVNHSHYGYGSEPLTKKDLMEIVAYARKKGLQVVPEVKFLSHQNKFLRTTHPELMYNEATYDPDRPEVYRIVFGVIDELISVIHPAYYHIGHDEVREKLKGMPNDQSHIPSPEAFARDVNKITKYLKYKGVETMMWGDMLLDPAMYGQPVVNGRRIMDKNNSAGMGGLNGAVQGYYLAIEQIDRSVIMADWHYNYDRDDFPSIDYFLSKGFRVMGATWHFPDTTRRFSAYVCSKKDARALGMIATTWNDFMPGKEVTMNQIVSESARAFSQCQ